MNRVMWMAAAALASWAVVASVAGAPASTDAFWGMLGPLVAAATSWMVMVRAYRRNPARLTAVMAQSLLVKLVFFAAYIIAGVKGLSLRPTVFVASLGAYFLAFHVVETVWLRRLLSSSLTPATR